MTKLTAADLMVIVDTLGHSLRIENFGSGWAKETREVIMNKVIDVMAGVSVEVTGEESNAD
jgi:hypothetical protein